MPIGAWRTGLIFWHLLVLAGSAALWIIPRFPDPANGGAEWDALRPLAATALTTTTVVALVLAGALWSRPRRSIALACAGAAVVQAAAYVGHFWPSVVGNGALPVAAALCIVGILLAIRSAPERSPTH